MGFTCPSCGKKATEEDLRKGRRPSKPKGERRKRVKKTVVEEKPTVKMSQPHIEEITWKSREPLPPGQHQRYGARKEWRPKPLQPVNRTLGEAVLSGRNIRPSGPIPDLPDSHSMELELKELEPIGEGKALERLKEKLEEHEKRLVIIVTSLERVEERVDGKVRELDAKTEDLSSKLSSFSTLISRMETLLNHYAVRQRPHTR